MGSREDRRFPILISGSQKQGFRLVSVALKKPESGGWEGDKKEKGISRFFTKHVSRGLGKELSANGQ